MRWPQPRPTLELRRLAACAATKPDDAAEPPCRRMTAHQVLYLVNTLWVCVRRLSQSLLRGVTPSSSIMSRMNSANRLFLASGCQWALMIGWDLGPVTS